MSNELYGHDDSADLSSRHRIDDSRKYPAQHPLLTWVSPADACHYVHLLKYAVKSVLRNQIAGIRSPTTVVTAAALRERWLGTVQWRRANLHLFGVLSPEGENDKRGKEK